MNKSKEFATDSAKQLRCSMCGQPFSQSEFKPFCSRRCQQIDLGNWLNERYGLPYEDEREPASDGPVSHDDGDTR